MQQSNIKQQIAKEKGLWRFLTLQYSSAGAARCVNGVVGGDVRSGSKMWSAVSK